MQYLGPKCGGTYRIVNTTNGKAYYGSCENFRSRAYRHNWAFVRNRHENQHLQHTFNAYGADALVFEVIEVIAGSKMDRKASEQSLIDKHWDGGVQCYNSQRHANGLGNPSKNPAETRRKLSEAQKGQRHSPATEYTVGHVTSDAQRTLLRAVNLGNRNAAGPRSEEAKRNIREGRASAKAARERMVA